MPEPRDGSSPAERGHLDPGMEWGESAELAFDRLQKEVAVAPDPTPQHHELRIDDGHHRGDRHGDALGLDPHDPLGGRIPPSRREDGRTAGWRRALRDAGRVVPEVFEAGWHPESGRELGHRIADRDDVTAVFCGNDAMAIGCYQAIYEAGKKVPEDYSVIGFDALKLSEYITPPLTTVMQPTFEIGFTAAKFLVDAIEFPTRRIPNKIFDTKLIIRESVKTLTSEK